MLKTTSCVSDILLACMLRTTSCVSDTKRQTASLRLNFQDGDLPSLRSEYLVSHVRGRSTGLLLSTSLTRRGTKGKILLDGAESIEVSDDKKKYVFHLRDHKWSDGSKVTAFEYENSWRFALQSGSDNPRADLFYSICNGQKAKKGLVPIEEIGVRAQDASTLVVELEYPNPNFLHLIAQPRFAPSKTPGKEPTVFNGPFVVSEWKKGHFLQLKPNEHFWNRSQVGLKQIDIYFIHDGVTATYMFEKLEIDWIGTPFSLLPQESIANLIASSQALTHPEGRYFWTYLNTQHPILSCQEIRRALALSVERKKIAEIYLDAEPTFVPLSQEVVPYAYSEEEAENEKEAQHLFAQGCAKLGLSARTLPPLTICYANAPGHKQIAEYLQQRWSQVFGAKFNLEGKEWNVFRSQMESGSFEIGGCLCGAFFPTEPFERFEELKSENYSQWDSPEFRKKMQLARQELDLDKRSQLLQQAQHLLIKDAPFIPLFRSLQIHAHTPTLSGHIFNEDGTVDFAYSQLMY